MAKAEMIIKKINELFLACGTVFKDEATDIWLRGLLMFDYEIIAKAADNWAQKQQKPPVLSQIMEACNRQLNYVESKTLQLPSEMLCRFHELGESQISRDLCERKISPADLQISQMQFNQALCSWHYAVLYDRLHPAGKFGFVESMLRDSQKLKTNGYVSQIPAKRKIFKIIGDMDQDRA